VSAWAEQFGTHHAIMVVDSFFENVSLHTMQHLELAPGEKEQNIVLQCTPKPAQSMMIACLYSHGTDPKEPDVRGFAAITDEPPSDVSDAGHDCCIVNLLPPHVEAWQTPSSRNKAELHAILSDRAVSLYQHQSAQAA
jgi:putative SOS response-associated peptidase YedK